VHSEDLLMIEENLSLHREKSKEIAVKKLMIKQRKRKNKFIQMTN
jgi:hypothetical protein